MHTYWVSQAGQVFGPYTIAQLDAMWSSGQITADALTCLDGSEYWRPVIELMRQAESPPLPEFAPVPRCGRRPMFWLSMCLVLVGLLLLVLWWPIGLLCWLVAVVIDRKHWECGACRNQVGQNARLCPSCGVGLKGYR